MSELRWAASLCCSSLGGRSVVKAKRAWAITTPYILSEWGLYAAIGAPVQDSTSYCTGHGEKVVSLSSGLTPSSEIARSGRLFV